jgi:FKBP-type peptidyl-prolyl cis-trans isomerase FkpA
MQVRTIAAALTLVALSTAGVSAHAAAQTPQPEVLPSGVSITITTPAAAQAAHPTATSLVRVHYRGMLKDGTEFDSSYKRGQPAVFPLNAVIPCWTQALQKMGVGSKAALVCPAETAYGAQGRPGIPPNATLYFEVELLATKND